MTRGGFTMPVSYEVIGDTDEGEHLFAWAGDAKAAAELAKQPSAAHPLPLMS